MGINLATNNTTPVAGLGHSQRQSIQRFERLVVHDRQNTGRVRIRNTEERHMEFIVIPLEFMFENTERPGVTDF